MPRLTRAVPVAEAAPPGPSVEAMRTSVALSGLPAELTVDTRNLT